MPLNLTALYSPWRGFQSAGKHVFRASRGGVEDLERGRGFERRQVEETRNSVRQLPLSRFSTNHRDDGCVGEEHVVLTPEAGFREHVEAQMTTSGETSFVALAAESSPTAFVVANPISAK
jgi:hypothetical protein